PIRHLEDLRARRGRRTRDAPAIGELVHRIEHDATRAERRLGSLVDLWTELVPATLVDHTRISGIRRGVLHVVVDSSPLLYELNTRLATGLEGELRRRYRGTLLRVRATVGVLEDGTGA
ncbi:MAG: DUF721 domain-containing protein, partial [Phycisphaerales bacterium]|nr:DUF721 domain-containing protein [Phycisphaerales bacterium]